MSGGFYSHNTQLLTNGDVRFRDTETIATRVQGIGYQTLLAGKYMNSYAVFTPYIPPGWTQWFAVSSFQVSFDWNNYEVTTGSSGSTSSVGTIVQSQQYITDCTSDRTLDFLDTTDGNPFYVYLSTNAPHYPNTPAPQDADLFADFTYSGRGYNEADMSDKPQYVQDSPPCEPAISYIRDSLRSLQAVDRAVGAVIDRVTTLGELDNTVFIFTSDHGTMWGEHRLCSKGHPYEESVRVPFTIVVPGMEPGTSDHLISANLDLGATIYDLLSIPLATDGKSLLPLLTPEVKAQKGGSPIEQREHLLLQTFKEPMWSGLVVDRSDGKWKYVERPDNEFELYDLVNDPFELENLQSNPTYAAYMTEFSATLADDRGLSMSFHSTPGGVINQPYQFQAVAWGGTLPYTWSVSGNSVLPDGVTLDTDTGILSGTPTEIGCFTGLFRVQATSIAMHYLQPEIARTAYDFCIDEDTDQDGIGDGADNCTSVANADQFDANGDGFGNICDSDTNDDCVINFADVALFKEAFLTADPVHDFNNSGVVNFGDLALLKANFLDPPGPSGLPNACTP